ncbi:xanthine dehydrogenase family protein molybdopterin-binding subunit [Natrarchaeobius halalkaliphilus]|uniref:Xanthine dehydrogenase family protein molybdopterin-binding subunit n=1 Tax=Natrarchaeobius halalkaliphilus TaxID=1679091 RepID=A0A3N6NWT0_9EURY|nr:molybdopterin cofactor-binding domain-containing protein [Natrarchaeobius halalkaliphilus]RQG89029.1 xanthine dehydrogenase family protein molybdopterin-binding subunit [Natrarchaeobius halalkaliphilus]
MASESDADERVFGSSVERREDVGLLTGEATFTDDELQDAAHVAILRSQYAHATIEGVETSAAEERDGVLAVYTGRDVEDSGIPNDIPTAWMLPGLVTPQYRIMATDRVRHTGDALAAVVAEDRYTAYDALEEIDVSYDRLEAVTRPDEAVDADVTVHEEAPDNVAFDFELGDADAVDDAFEAADHVTSVDLEQPRIIPNAVEPRAAAAAYDTSSDDLTIWMTSQNPHLHRVLLSTATLGHPEHKLRIVAPEVGGGFGSKIYHYPDEAITAWCAKQLGGAVEWQATRTEGYVTDCHGRDHVTEAELALDSDGTIRGLRVETHAGLGAHLSQFATATPSYLYATILSSEYAIPAIHCRVIGAFTNTTPVDAYRGAGRAEGIYVTERIVDVAARELDLDPVDVRRTNLIPPEEFPYETAVALVYDSGEYEEAMDRALELIDYEDVRERQAKLREEGRYLGVGVANFVESAGLSPSKAAGELGATAGGWEAGVVRFHPSGTVSVACGTADQGQGHRTTLAQVAAAELGVPVEDVEVVEGDTDEVPQGMGTYGSRSAPVGGGAVAQSGRKVVEKGRSIAAHKLEASEEDVEFDDGTFHVAGAPDRSISIQELAYAAYLGHDIPDEMEPGLEATSYYDPENFTFPFGTHAAVVEVDPDTGEVEFHRYVAVDDCGEQINPMIVEGQVHGGIAQGIGAALFEAANYDDNGTLVSGSMNEYALPRAERLPEYETDSTVTPSPHNPIGVKGVGESATIGATPAVVNAVVDALEPFGVDHLDMPLTNETVWAAIDSGGEP